MKRWVVRLCLLVALVAYATIWGQARNQPSWTDQYLAAPMPAQLLKIASGYGQHMAGFGLFIKNSIFTGNNRLVGIDNYATTMARNFEAASELYPKFIDIYFFTQSFLPHVSPATARRTNAILERGVAAHPEQLLFPFFQAFNYFKYLDQPLKAADMFAEMAQRPDAPTWFNSLSAKLRARGGQLSAGRDMLVAMYKSETNEKVRERYAKDIGNFDKALQVQAVLDLYRLDQGTDAETLDDLVPVYLKKLPELELGYILKWKPPILKLTNPAVK